MVGNESETPYPIRLDRSATELTIGWSDGLEQKLSIAKLQQRCPCATCRERRKGLAEQAGRSQLAIVSSETPTAVTIERMGPVGNYAYSIHYDRGCNKGIYSFEFLRGLTGSGAGG